MISYIYRSVGDTEVRLVTEKWISAFRNPFLQIQRHQLEPKKMPCFPIKFFSKYFLSLSIVMIRFKYVKLRKNPTTKILEAGFPVSAWTDKITASVSFKASRDEG